MTPIQPTSRARSRKGKPNGFSRRSLIDQLITVDDDLEDILVKQPRDLTEVEVRRIAERRLALPAGDEKDALYALEKAFFEDVYGSEQATADGTGRLAAPVPKRPVNASPIPARSADGMELSRAVSRLAERVADIAETQGSRDAVRFLQQGLTILNQARTAAGPASAQGHSPVNRTLFQDLVDDGMPGPKTRAALRRTTARLGAPKVEEGLALGQFEETLKRLARGDLPDGIKPAAAEAFAALFRDPDQGTHKGAATEEGESLQMAIKNASIAVTGIWQADDDGVLNPSNIRLTPGTIIPKAVGSAGLRPLEAPGRFDLSQVVLQDLRAGIRRALLADRLGQIEGPRMTATEVLERVAEISRLLGATYGRLQSELLTPLVTRGLAILTRRGEVPALRIDSKVIDLEYKSPLARHQAQQDVQATLAFLDGLARMGPTALAIVDVEQAAQTLAAAYGVPPKILKSPDSAPAAFPLPASPEPPVPNDPGSDEGAGMDIASLASAMGAAQPVPPAGDI
ncbi:MAG: portal protein [Rhodospirillales bacterium]